MTAAHLRAGLHLIYLVAPLVRLACIERSGCACSESEWPSLTVATMPAAGTHSGRCRPAMTVSASGGRPGSRPPRAKLTRLTRCEVGGALPPNAEHRSNTNVINISAKKSEP